MDALQVPDDLAVALGAHGAAFGAMARSYRRNVLRWLRSAKRPETRATHIARIVGATAKSERLPQM